MVNEIYKNDILSQKVLHRKAFSVEIYRGKLRLSLIMNKGCLNGPLSLFWQLSPDGRLIHLKVIGSILGGDNFFFPLFFLAKFSHAILSHYVANKTHSIPDNIPTHSLVLNHHHKQSEKKFPRYFLTLSESW